MAQKHGIMQVPIYKKKFQGRLEFFKAHCKPFNVRKCVKACNRRKRFIVANGFFLDGAMSIGSHRSSHMWLRDGVTPPGWPFEAMKGPDTTFQEVLNEYASSKGWLPYETLGIKVKTQANVSGRLIQVSEMLWVWGRRSRASSRSCLRGTLGSCRLLFGGHQWRGPKSFSPPWVTFLLCGLHGARYYFLNRN